MLHRTEDFEVVLRGPAKEVVDRRAVTDFSPIYEDLLLESALRGASPNDGRRIAGALSAVRCDGRLTGLAASLGAFEARYGLRFFQYAAWDMLQAHGLLSREARAASPHSVELYLKPVEQEATRGRACVTGGSPYPFVSRPLADFGVVDDAPHPGSLAVFVASGLASELQEVTRRNADRECLSLLCGRLVVNPAGGLAVVLTSRREVRDAQGSSEIHFAIAPEAFLEAARATSGANGDEVVCGWHHNHPASIAAEAGEPAAGPMSGSAFLSVDDHKVFRTWFRAAYFVALVTGWSKDPADVTPMVKAYGWRSALVEEIPFRVF